MFARITLLFCFLFLMPVKADDVLPVEGRKYLSLDGYSVVSAFSKEASNGYSFVIAQKDSKWELIDGELNANELAEKVAINPDSKKIWVLYQRACPSGNKVDGVCTCHSGALGNERKKDGYNLCTSAFKKVDVNVSSGAAWVITAPILLAAGTVAKLMSQDSAAIIAAVKEAGVLDGINKQYYLEYKNSFSFDVKSISALQRSIDRYSSEKYDPDSLIPMAQARLQSLLSKKDEDEKYRALTKYRNDFEGASDSLDWYRFVFNYQHDDPDNLVPEARKRLKVAEDKEEKERKADAARIEKEKNADAARRRKEMKEEDERFSKWRKSLKVGDDTFCGPVIELKLPMVKISVRPQLPGYGNEAWLKTSELFPPSYGCSNVNGRLFPIAD